MAGADPECASVVLDALAREGVVLRSGVDIRQVRPALARVQVDIVAGDDAEQKTQTIEGSHLLVAVGRRPNLENLDLDAAGIRYQPGGIVVDSGLRTTNKHVYAIGDVTGAPQLSHLAHHQAGLVIRNALFRTPVDADRYAVPVVTYTDPELAQVGLTEDEARAQVGVIRVLRAPYRENDRARATGATHGHIKIVTDRKGTILGATIVGAGGIGKYRGLDARHKPKAEYRGLCRCYRAVSDLCRGGQTRRDDLFHPRFDESSGASHHRVAASFWLISVSRKRRLDHD